MFGIFGDIISLVVGFLGAFTLIKFRPSIAGLIQKNVSDAEDKISNVVSKSTTSTTK